MVRLDDIRAAQRRLEPFVVRTPLERSVALSQLCGADVWLKMECFQRTGSFKLRGALNALMLLGADARAAGVLTASAGNHGLGVARAAELLSIPATVVVPLTASAAKVEALRHSGAQLVQHGTTYDEAEQYGRRLAREIGRSFVSPYNDPAVIAGAGTIGLEILADLPAVHTVVIPAGGGGLISGIGVAVHGLATDVAIVGVQSVASPALQRAVQVGRAVGVKVGPSLADGLAGNIESGSITIALAREHVREMLLVEEPQIAPAMRWLLEHEHVLVEGSAAVGVAALLAWRLTCGGPIVIVLSGRNVAFEVLRD